MKTNRNNADRHLTDEEYFGRLATDYLRDKAEDLLQAQEDEMNEMFADGEKMEMEELQADLDAEAEIWAEEKEMMKAIKDPYLEDLENDEDLTWKPIKLDRWSTSDSIVSCLRKSA